MEYDFGTGGYDIEFYLDETNLSTDQGVVICSNVSYDPDDTSARSFLLWLSTAVLRLESFGWIGWTFRIGGTRHIIERLWAES